MSKSLFDVAFNVMSMILSILLVGDPYLTEKESSSNLISSSSSNDTNDHPNKKLLAWHKIIVCGLKERVQKRNHGVIFLGNEDTRIDGDVKITRVILNIKKLYNMVTGNKKYKRYLEYMLFPDKPSPIQLRLYFFILAKRGFEPEETIVKETVKNGYIEVKKLKEILDKMDCELEQQL